MLLFISKVFLRFLISMFPKFRKHRIGSKLLDLAETAAQKKNKIIGIKPRSLDGEQEAKLVAICCSQPPEGRARWTLKLLSNQLVELEVVESIASETVRQTLKKMNLSLG